MRKRESRLNGYRVSAWDDEQVLEMESGGGCKTVSTYLMYWNTHLKMVKVVKCFCIFYNKNLKPTGCYYTRPILYSTTRCLLFLPSGSASHDSGSLSFLAHSVLCFAPHTPHQEYLAPSSSLDSCPSLKTKFLGLSWNLSWCLYSSALSILK